jgi:uracil-DNA glycosylase
MKVLFVGDRPSRLNKDPKIAFVGTPSYKNLLRWIKRMGGITDFSAINSHDGIDRSAIADCWRSGGKVVALGNNASKRLTKIGIEHFKLPHPSPLNRQLNNEYFIEEKLWECYSYLKETSRVYNL